MKRRLNVKGLLALLGGVALFGIGAHFLHGYQVKRQAGSLREQAERAESHTDYRAAIGYLRRYLGFQPGDTDALARYGRLLARQEVATTPRARLFAVSILEGALRREPARDEERRLVIELSLELHLYKEARYHLESLLGVKWGEDVEKRLEHVLKEGPKAGELVGKLARCCEAQGFYRRARELYELAVRSLPRDVSHHVSLAHLLRDHTDDVLRPGKNGKNRETAAALHQQADQLLDSLVKTNPDSSRSYVARAQYRRRYPLPAGREAMLEAIGRDLRKALKLASDDADVLLGLAELARDRNQLSEAEKFLRQGLTRHPRDWRMYQAVARLERGADQVDAALSSLREGLEVLPEQIELLWEYADLLVAIGSSEASAAIEQLQKKGVPQAERDVLTARLLVREQEWARAVQLLVNAHAQLIGRENLPQSSLAVALVEQCNVLLTQCYERLGDPYRAQHAYQRILTRKPRSLEARLGLARTEAALGRLREAESRYRQLARLPNAPGAMIEVARLVLQRNLRRENPDWEEIDEALRQAERLQPRPVEVALLRADALLARAELEADEGKKAHLREEARGVLLVNLLSGMPIGTGLIRPEMIPVAALPQPRALVRLWTGLAAVEELAGRPESSLKVLAEAERQLLAGLGRRDAVRDPDRGPGRPAGQGPGQVPGRDRQGRRHPPGRLAGDGDPQLAGALPRSRRLAGQAAAPGEVLRRPGADRGPGVLAGQR
jgi:tetratricopeptide (TPR) repeat protein